MNILIVGNGGREHALVWKLKQSKLAQQIYVAPGNAGTNVEAINLPIATSDFEGIVNSCINYKVDIVVIGPEEPLVNGLYDVIKDNPKTKDVIVIGPSKNAAQLEGSKSFAKAFMEKYNIPTAKYKEFNKESFDEGILYIKNHALPIVLKADGLAGGKGVIICENHLQATAEFEMMIKYSKFGDAGYKVVVEEFLDGKEYSVFAITDGVNYKILPEAKDYKRIGEGGKGLNTGGMGSLSPVPYATDALYKIVEETIIKPTIKGLQEEKMTYEGFVFFGLIIVNNLPFVIEYNCRLGDPETEVVLPRLQNDLLELFIAVDNGTLNEQTIAINPDYALSIVAASGGYPTTYETGYIISGLQNECDSKVFVAGAVNEQNEIVTSGGRVLVVSSLASNFKEALDKCKATLGNIEFEDMYFRRDIGAEFIQS
jgi:phosphoribosylamine---glycine ligase